MIRLYLAIAIALAIAAGSAAMTYGLTSNYYGARLDSVKAERDRELAQAQLEAAQKREKLQEQVAELTAKAAEVREIEVVKWKTIKQEVDRVVEKPVYRDCRLDDDGLRVYNAAAVGMRIDPAAFAPASVPANPTVAEVGRNDGRPAGGGGVGVRAVPRLPSRP